MELQLKWESMNLQADEKAKMISINPAYRYAVGIRITAKHVGFVLVNLKSEIEKYERIRLEFSTEASYYSRLREELHHFLADVEIRTEFLELVFLFREL